MKLCSLFVGEEGRDCERELEDCLGDFDCGVVGELDAPRFVKDVSMFGNCFASLVLMMLTSAPSSKRSLNGLSLMNTVVYLSWDRLRVGCCGLS